MFRLVESSYGWRADLGTWTHEEEEDGSSGRRRPEGDPPDTARVADKLGRCRVACAALRVVRPVYAAPLLSVCLSTSRRHTHTHTQSGPLRQEDVHRGPIDLPSPPWKVKTMARLAHLLARLGPSPSSKHLFENQSKLQTITRLPSSPALPTAFALRAFHGPLLMPARWGMATSS
jgi:hypothetical protein